MLTSYLKLALRVLGRKKFYTAITLFGISFTLAILMLIVSYYETELGSAPPLTEKDQIVILPMLTLQRSYLDTIYTADTSYVDGEMVIDSNFTTQDAGKSISQSSFSLDFLEEYYSDIPSADNYSFFSTQFQYNAFVNETKVDINAAYVDYRFWEILQFDFIEGFGFTKEIYDQGEQVVIITDQFGQQYFGREKNLLDEEIDMDGKNYKVIGVIREPGISLLESNVFAPNTVLSTEERGNEMGFGGFSALIYADRSSSIPAIRDEIDVINSQIPLSPEVQESYDEIIIWHHSYNEIYSQNLLYFEDSKKSLRIMRWVVIGLISLFVILPTLNLINLNVSRIMERSSEIGVRKAFGASRSTLLRQFIFENIVQTLIGGVLGLLLALLLIYLINDNRLLGSITLKANYHFYFYSLLVCILFGVLSGLLPAWRMSKIHIVNALKQSKI